MNMNMNIIEIEKRQRKKPGGGRKREREREGTQQKTAQNLESERKNIRREKEKTKRIWLREV